jgi:hypothetical protein
MARTNVVFQRFSPAFNVMVNTSPSRVRSIINRPYPLVFEAGSLATHANRRNMGALDDLSASRTSVSFRANSTGL